VGKGQWVKVAKMLPGRTAKQCEARYHTHVKPGLALKPFSQEEAVKLKEVRLMCKLLALFL
jgi:hypothetical protein